MTSSFPIPRKFIILGIVLPLAVLLGYLLAGPVTYNSLMIYGMVAGVLLLPILLRWHHPLLIFSLNAAIVVFFLPGKPQMWMVLALGSIGISVLNRILNKEYRLLTVPSMNWTLGILLLVVLITAKFTGGINLRSAGGDLYGGKKYIYLIMAAATYFAISVRKTPLAKAGTMVDGYFLSTLTAALCNLIYMVGPGLWWLFIVFQVDFAIGQATEDFTVGSTSVKMSRVAGLAPATLAVNCWLLARFGIRGMLDTSKPWRLLVLLLSLALNALSGFRSGLIFFGLLLLVQFVLEGLWRTRLMMALAISVILGFSALIPFADKLPLSVQRTLSFLPLDIDPVARLDAKGSTEWRLRMWQVVSAQIPRYFWLGKGYVTSSSDLYFAQQSANRGFGGDFEICMVAGDYHNGPLSVIIPFGIWGVLAFLAFMIAAGRVLYFNYRYGDPALKSINTLLFAYFLTRAVSFVVIFGAFDSDMVFFAALTGLSVSLNGGVASPSVSIPAGSATRQEGIPPTSAGREMAPAFAMRRRQPWRR